jgi:hypothetical protein
MCRFTERLIHVVKFIKVSYQMTDKGKGKIKGKFVPMFN